jgi:group I intron endonuclease
MSIGIYRIINPEGKTYIGQSINIEKRWKGYKKLHCKGQCKLYNSLKKYYPENHIFEIIEECTLEELDKREIYWKKHYLSIFNWDVSLFLQIKDGKGGSKSQETKNKISKANKGKQKPKEFGYNHSNKMKGKQLSQEHKDNISNSNKGKILSEGTKQKQSISHIGKKLGPQTLQHKLKISISNKNKNKHTDESKSKIGEKNSKPKNENWKKNHSDKMKGKQSRLDKNIYLFFNQKTNISYLGTRHDFINNTHIPSGNISLLINNKQKSTHGWILLNKK